MLKVFKRSQNLLFQNRQIFKELNDRSIYITKCNFCSNKEYNMDETEKKLKSTQTKSSPIVSSKYELFTDENATIILDIEEERDKILANELAIEEVNECPRSLYDGLNLNRGKSGVFDVEDLIEVLKRDNAENIFVCTVPKELNYVDYLCVITGRSHRHMKAIAEFVRKMYKLKRSEVDLIPKIEGKNSEEWIAMDMGNIALHIFSADVRKKYDLEMLWSVGAKYDTEANKPEDSIVELFERHAVSLDGIPLNELKPEALSSHSFKETN